MNDDTTATALRHRLAEARDAMSDVHMTVPDRAIFASAARCHIRRGLAAALTAACAAAGLALGLALPGGPGREVHLHLAAWSVDTNRNGTVTVTVRQLTHAAQLQDALAKAGVPAVVTFRHMCLNTNNQNALHKAGVRLKASVHPPGEIITPSQIPHGDKLLFSIITVTVHSSSGRVTHGRGFGWGLVQAGQPLHCIQEKSAHPRAVSH